MSTVNTILCLGDDLCLFWEIILIQFEAWLVSHESDHLYWVWEKNSLGCDLSRDQKMILHERWHVQLRDAHKVDRWVSNCMRIDIWNWEMTENFAWEMFVQIIKSFSMSQWEDLFSVDKSVAKIKDVSAKVSLENMTTSNCEWPGNVWSKTVNVNRTV